MLRVAIDIVPGDREGRKSTVAVAEISNIGGALLANYHVEISDEAPGWLKEAEVRSYPRWFASVWDLVLRYVPKALYGKKQLPERPLPGRRVGNNIRRRWSLIQTTAYTLRKLLLEQWHE